MDQTWVLKGPVKYRGDREFENFYGFGCSSEQAPYEELKEDVIWNITQRKEDNEGYIPRHRKNVLGNYIVKFKGSLNFKNCILLPIKQEFEDESKVMNSLFKSRILGRKKPRTNAIQIGRVLIETAGELIRLAESSRTVVDRDGIKCFEEAVGVVKSILDFIDPHVEHELKKMFEENFPTEHISSRRSKIISFKLLSLGSTKKVASLKRALSQLSLLAKGKSYQDNYTDEELKKTSRELIFIGNYLRPRPNSKWKGSIFEGFFERGE